MSRNSSFFNGDKSQETVIFNILPILNLTVKNEILSGEYWAINENKKTHEIIFLKENMFLEVYTFATTHRNTVNIIVSLYKQMESVSLNRWLKLFCNKCHPYGSK